MEPHEEIWKKETGQWYNIPEHTHQTDTFTPFNGLHGFSVGGCAYKGTLFRFPLRNFMRERGISSHVYDIHKLRDLLRALREEAKQILLFLRSVRIVEVHEIAENGVVSDLLQVRIQEIHVPTDQLRQKKFDFQKKLETTFESQSFRISGPIELTVRVQVVVVDRISSSNSSQSEWLVASQVGSRSSDVHNVAEALKVLPWVGVALEINTLAATAGGGRVFCVLPMPHDVSCHLPVHVNATFSLNDERRELKWTGIERTNDNSAKWNNLVVRYLLPPCYAALLLNHAIMLLKAEHFYRAWPDVNLVGGTHWEGVLQPLFQELFLKSVFWSQNCASRIKANLALFTPRDTQLPSVVTDALSACGEKLVTVPTKVWDALNFMDTSVHEITPENTRAKLRRSLKSYMYYKFSVDQKLELLRYCLSDNAFDDLFGLALVPLANGTFTTFIQRTLFSVPTPVYLCSSQCPRDLLPNLEGELVDIESVDIELFKKLVNVANSNHTQLQLLNSSNVANLLIKSMPSEWRYKQVVTLPHSRFPTEWFELFWNWVAGENLELFSQCLVVPVFNSQSGIQAVTQLSPASPSVLIPRGTARFTQNLASALSKLGVSYCEQRSYHYVQHYQLPTYLNYFSANGVLDAICNASHYTNVSLTSQEAYELRMCLCDWTYTSQRQATLQKLAIFITLPNSGERLYSVTQANLQVKSICSKAQVKPNDFPLSAENFPPHFILFASSEYHQLRLLQRLCLVPSTSIDLLINSVFPLIRNGSIAKSPTTHLMKEVLENIHTITSGAKYHQKQTLNYVISELLFIPVSDGSIKSPKSLFNPSDPELQSLFKGKSVFPIEPFVSEKCISVLKSCGLRTTVSPKQIVDIIQEICCTSTSSMPQPVDVERYTRAKAVIEYIGRWDSQVMSESVSIEIKSSGWGATQLRREKFSKALLHLSQKNCWLPVQATHPHDYPICLGWKGTDCTCHFISFQSSVILRYDQASLASACGSQVYFVDHSLPAEICEIFSPHDEPQMLVKHIIAHLDIVICNHRQIVERVRTITQIIYRFLQEYLHYTEQYKTLLSKECVWITKRKKFVSPRVVALQHNPSFRHNLEPFVYTLPDDLEDFSSLFEAIGVEKVVSEQQIVGILEKIKDGSSESLGVSNEVAWELVMTILNWLTGNGEHSVESSAKLYVPIKCDSAWPTLIETQDVVFTENDFLRCYVGAFQSPEYKFINHRVSPQMAHLLGLTPLSQYLDIAEDAFEDAGPNEPLTVRLKNILKDYKDGLTIIKELLQNADDAEATEMNICYDTRHHRATPEKLFFPGMEACHGPALVVHNNAEFTQDDFKNITKLAGATKEDQPLKIGKFGVGFCSVYHITDIPSFISNRYLYIFDPTLTYLKKEIRNPAKPGKKVIFSTKFIRSSQQMAPYNGLFGFKSEETYAGTMFRFPFRTSASELSGKIYSEGDVTKLTQEIQNCSSKLLLFLQNVNCITVSQISDGETSPKNLLKVVNTKRKLGSLCIHTVTCSSNSLDTTTEHWVVATHTETVLRQLSTSSVACALLPQPTEEVLWYTPKPVEGEVFCFLPLSIKTGLPVHVSSNFAVSNNRIGIWTSDDYSRQNIQEVQWNETLMKYTIPKAYNQILEAIKQLHIRSKLQQYVFSSLWPLEANLQILNPWRLLVQSLYSIIARSELFFSACISKWLSLSNSRFLSPDILRHSSTSTTLPECVAEVVNCLKLPIVHLPQEYHAHLSLGSSVITEEEFLDKYFCNIKTFGSIVESRNEVLCLTLECFITEQGQHNEGRCAYLFFYLKSNACIPCAPDGELLRKCSDVIDPKAKFAKLFDEEERLFPLPTFCEKQLVHKAMEVLEMRCTSISMQMLIERARSVPSLYEIDQTKALQYVQLILKCLEPEILESDKDKDVCEASIGEDTLADVQFIPVMPKPEGYLLEWFGEKKRLLSGKELMLKGTYVGDTTTNVYNAGSQVSFISDVEPEYGGCGHISYTARQFLKIRELPEFEEVIAHFEHLIDVLTSQTPKPDMIEQADAIARQVYKYLDEVLREQTSIALRPSQAKASTNELDFSTLRTHPCVWTGRMFIHCDKVAQEWKLKEGPYLYQVPDSLDKENLLRALDIKKEFAPEDLINALQQLHNDYNSEELPASGQRLVSVIISELNDAEIPEEHLPIMLPDDKFVMYEASTLAFNDAQWLEQEKGYTYVNQNLITRDLARKLGVKTIRSKVLEKFRKKRMFFPGTKFGQSEELPTRIHNILQDYPFDVTILKELLQNADDAKATKMYVILDMRTHRGERVLSEHWQELQGPALLVWNDSEFSEEDIEGIQKLGVGNKRSDSETIGQYGIGFNSVYHLTDCPSIITGGNTLCIFDPHCKYAPDATKEFPGERYDELSSDFWKKFHDMKPAYLLNKLQDCPPELLRGSLFRFPLRHTKELVDASDIIGGKDGEGNFEGILSAEKMHSHLKKWAPQMKQSMFFLNHVTEMKFFVIPQKGRCLKVEYHYKVEIDKSAKLHRAELHKKIAQFNDNQDEPFITKYQLSLVEITGVKEQKEQWLIQQGIGDIENKEQRWQFVDQVKPRHGIAAPLSHPKHCCGRVFCFLPLPIESKLPVHINGHFILHSSRRMLWKTTDNDDLDSKQQWNISLLKAIATSYAHLLMAAKEDYLCESGEVLLKDIYKYYHVFPRWTAPLPKLEESSSSATASADPKAHKTLKSGQAIAVTKAVLSVHKHSSFGHSKHSSREEKSAASPSLTPKLTVRASIPVVGKPSLSLLSSAHTPEVTPTGDWLELAKNVFTVLSAFNAKVIAISELSKQNDEKSRDHKPRVFVEWCPLKNKECPASQAYFVSSSVDKSLKVVLTRLGMKLTCAFHWIRKHFQEIGLRIPTLSAEEAFSYYSKFHQSILSSSGSFPFHIKQTPFRSMEDFKTFTYYILPPIPDVQSHSDFPEPAFELPLLVTADGYLRLFHKDSNMKVIRSTSSSLFPKCLQWFLHKTLIGVPYSPEYFLNERSEEDEEACLGKIEELLSSVLPASLAKNPCVQCAELSLVTKVWRFMSKNEIFEHFLNKILHNWALLLSHDDKLYSCCLAEKAVLPIVPLETPRGHSEQRAPQTSTEEVERNIGSEESNQIDMEICTKVSAVLEMELKLPFLNTNIVPPQAVKGICPTLLNPAFILRVFHNFHCASDITHLITESVSVTLIEYFGNIHLKKDASSLKHLRGLPLFLTHTGHFTSLSDKKKVYVWPDRMCTEGSAMWLSDYRVVFLDSSGEWTSLGMDPELQIESILPIEIYTKFVFDKVSMMNEDQRYKHLRFIRDSLFQEAMMHSNNNLSDTYMYTESACFVSALRSLKCLGSDTEHLKAIEDLYSHEEYLFITFDDIFSFLPKPFRKGEKVQQKAKLSQEEINEVKEYQKWMDFFKELGLRCDVSTTEFIELCERVAAGKYVHSTREKSNALLNYLFTQKAKKEWYDDKYHMFRSQIASIRFVCADQVEDLTWIAPAPKAQSVVHGVPLTTLKGACVSQHKELVWSLIQVICPSHIDVESDADRHFVRKLSVLSPPHINDVIQNIKHISRMFSDPSLFGTYNISTPEKKDTNLTTVIAKCFKYLNRCFSKPQRKPEIFLKIKRGLEILCKIPCIPVPAQKNAVDNKHVVLVKPGQVMLSSEAKEYHPFLHQIPHVLTGSTQLLELIGVKSSVELSHLQLVLELAHEQLKDSCIDPNTLKIVGFTLHEIYTKLKLSQLVRMIGDCDVVKQLKPLYLPGHDDKLHDSQVLMYPDTFSYRNCRLHHQSCDRDASYYQFNPPVSDSVDTYTFADAFCCLLPLQVRPRPMSQICIQRLSPHCTPLDESCDIDVATRLKRAFSLDEFPEACLKVVEHVTGTQRDRCLVTLFEKLHEMQVCTINNLEVDVVLQETDTSIGTAKVNFYLQLADRQPGKYLYLDSNITLVMEHVVYNTLAEELAIIVQNTVPQQTPINQLPLSNALRMLLVVQKRTDIREVCQFQKIGLGGTGLEDIIEADFESEKLSPKVGSEIPFEMLDPWPNNQNIFQYQELIGYEQSEGYFILAEVLHIVLPDDFNPESDSIDPLQTRYSIRISEDDKVVHVTTLDMYKILRGPKQQASDESTAILPL